ncbi:MAG TPA: transposase [Planctomycetota bacterium]
MRRPQITKPVFWHVMARGARRLGIFWDDEDFQIFLSILRTSTRSTEVQLAGYTLMNNHFHMIMEATSLALSACMRRLNYSYSRFHNEKHHLSGHTFDGPFQRYVQPTPRLALSKLAYVFLNPVRAGLTGSPGSYRWSNYTDYSEGYEEPHFTSTLLRKVAPSDSEAKRLFKRAMDLELSRQDRRKAELPTAREIQSMHFEWLKDLALERSDHLAGENPTLVAMLWARNCGVFPAAMAAVETGMKAADISRELWSAKKRLTEAGTLDRLLALAS